ncbi:hypothetical protein ACS5NO_28140 [Larkinella sp. GY13]|uniref:hypothetical protein n=1 Tax=Larkinella sp. GY13 TaxID=3453720 RepID=UPI003EEA0B53
MNKFTGIFGLFLIAISQPVANWATSPAVKYGLSLGFICTGLALTVLSDLLFDLAQWISQSGFWTSRYQKASTRWKGVVDGTFWAGIGAIFVAALLAFAQSSLTKTMPPLSTFYFVTGCILVVFLTRNIKFPDAEGLSGTGFDNAFGRELFVKVAKGQFIYVKPPEGMVSWKQYAESQYVVLSNRDFFVLDTHTYSPESTIKKLFAQSDDSYVDAWIRINFRTEIIRTYKEMDHETLTMISDFSGQQSIASFLKGGKEDFEQMVVVARAAFQQAWADQIRNPQNYYANRQNLSRSIQNFTDIALHIKEKIRKYLNQTMQTVYLTSRELNQQIFTVDIVLSYVFNNTPFNGQLIEGIDRMLTQLIQEERTVETTNRQIMLQGLIDAIKITGRPELVRHLWEKVQLAENSLYRYGPTSSTPMESAFLTPQDVPLPRPTEAEVSDSEIMEAVQELVRFLNSPMLHTDNVHLNLESFVGSLAYFRKNAVDFRKLSKLLLERTSILDKNGEINTSRVLMLLQNSLGPYNQLSAHE